jgi:hypothetical protein
VAPLFFFFTAKKKKKKKVGEMGKGSEKWENGVRNGKME